MSKHEELKALAERFVSGYVAGSCNSYDECRSRFTEEVKEVDESICDQQIELILDQAIDEAEIFLCECCGWWCWAHEHSEVCEGNCSECSPSDEEE